MRDAVVVGSGPNGLTAAVELARAGLEVQVLEGHDVLGGGTRTDELTLPGYRHDVCAAIHPFATGSPAFRTMPLQDFGLEWKHSPAEVAHPLDGGRNVSLFQDVERTALALGGDAPRYRRTIGHLAGRADEVFADTLGPLVRFPTHPMLMARFGLQGLVSAHAFAKRFETEEARGLFAGNAAHNTTSLDVAGSAAIGLALMMAGHAYRWPMASGGSHAVTRALAGYLESLGGEIVTGHPVRAIADLPPARLTLLSMTPPAVDALYGDRLPRSYRRVMQRWRFGPGVFKVDWALDGPIPWTAAEVAQAATVHVGGPLEEIVDSEQAVWDGRHSDRPFVLLVQHTLADPTRAPEGGHTAWAYCHVPNGSTVDRTEVIEAQIERFAPGFRDRILQRHVMSSEDYARYNPNYVGGDIIGGAFTLKQIVARPKLSANPYATPLPGVFLCGSSAAPGAGVHGMVGWHAAHAALRSIGKQPFRPS